jgi:hypothetical protein
LAIVRHVVELHGGSVSAASRGKGQGSTFKVTFPAAPRTGLTQPEGRRREADFKQPEQRTRQEEPQLDGVRVLVVEDDPDTLDLIRFILEQSGAEVSTALSTGAALQLLERWRPDVLVSDLALPDQDGYELIAHVRSRAPESSGNIPAVALSAYARTEDRIRAIAAGFQMHVTKPVDPDELVAVVANLTNRGNFSP